MNMKNDKVNPHTAAGVSETSHETKQSHRKTPFSVLLL